jgi:hypothetical protein
MTDPPSVSGTAAHPIMFWVLTTLALAVFTPCVLVPIVVESQEIRAYEAAAVQSLADMKAQVEKNEARIEALRTDPLVNDRIVRRELNYRPDGEQVVQLPAGELTQVRPGEPAMTRVAPASQDQKADWFLAAAKWLPRWPWRELFAKSPNRSLLLAMSGGLLVAAFLLYGRPVSARPRRSS